MPSPRLFCLLSCLICLAPAPLLAQQAGEPRLSPLPESAIQLGAGAIGGGAGGIALGFAGLLGGIIFTKSSLLSTSQTQCEVVCLSAHTGIVRGLARRPL